MAKTKTFEESMNELEEIVNQLENGDLTLDQSIEKFQKGMQLSQKCSKELDNAEKKISMIIEKEGNFEQIPFQNLEE